MGQDKVTPVEKAVWEGRERNGQEFLLLTSEQDSQEDAWGGPGGSLRALTCAHEGWGAVDPSLTSSVRTTQATEPTVR